MIVNTVQCSLYIFFLAELFSIGRTFFTTWAKIFFIPDLYIIRRNTMVSTFSCNF